MNKPKVTIACITYNHEKYILECLEGVFMQKCDFEYEVIIHDDCSTDGTQNIIREYTQQFSDNVHLIFQDVNQYSKGKKPLIDFILPKAQGEYIAFCEGDDYWTNPNKLQNQVDLLDGNPDLAFCSHNVSRVNNDGEIINQPTCDDTVIYFSSADIFSGYFPTLSLVFRKLDLGYVSELKTAFNGDAVLTALLSKYGGAAHMGFNGAAYRVHDKGVFSQNDYTVNAIKSLETRKLLLKHGRFTDPQFKALEKEYFRRKIALAKYALKRGKWKLLFKII